MLWSRRLQVLGIGLVFLVQPALAAGAEALSADERILEAAHVGTDGPALLEFFRQRTVTSKDWEWMKALVQQLGDNSYQIRQKASEELAALGQVVKPLLQQAAASPDLEVVRRAEECLLLINERDAGAALPAAAARLLATRRPAGTAAVLLAYLPFAADEFIAQAVRAALTTVARPDGRVVQIVVADPWLAVSLALVAFSEEKVLAAALYDRAPACRRAAAEALCQAGLTSHLPAVRELLRDPDATVRLQVALTLASAREREAVPVLIDLLTQLPYSQGQQAEYLLYQLAQGQAPPVPLGNSDAARRQCHDAWLAWWRAQGAAADLSRLDKDARPLGYTLLVLLDLGRIMELDADGKERWKLEGLDFPLDVQILPGERILIAEHNGSRVTERNRKGEVVWEHKVDGPLVAQRLANGNTFIATQTQFLEVDRSGKEVYVQPPPGGDYIMKALKLPSGEIACVTNATINTPSRYLRFRPMANQTSKSFPVNVRTYGGRLDVLPNGHVLVPEHALNRVVEYDAAGKAVSQLAVSQPVAAVRLSNGNTLVTSMNENRAIEFDRTGKQQVWEYKADTRVTRAFRR